MQGGRIKKDIIGMTMAIKQSWKERERDRKKTENHRFLCRMTRERGRKRKKCLG